MSESDNNYSTLEDYIAVNKGREKLTQVNTQAYGQDSKITTPREAYSNAISGGADRDNFPLLRPGDVVSSGGSSSDVASGSIVEKKGLLKFLKKNSMDW